MDLAQLNDLARDSSKDGRDALVSALTDLFLASGGEESERVSELYGDIVCHVFDQLQTESRLALADRVSSHPEAPPDLMRRLAHDVIEVARPVLQRAVVLTADDLVDVAEQQSQAHLCAIAMRNHVEPEVSKAVAKRGQMEALLTILKNSGAAIDDEGYKHITNRARKVPQLQEALLDRTDLTKAAADALVPFLTRELERRVRELGDNEVILKALDERPRHKVNVHLHDLGDKPSKVQLLIESVVAGKTKIDEAVEIFTARDRPIDLGTMIAKVIGAPENSVLRIIFREEDAPLVILCRAAGVSDKAYEKIIAMRAKRLKMTSSAISDALQRYRSMTPELAARSLETIRPKLAS